ncbi:MAG: helix-turn-helix domain-containing protein [Candidatus Onthomonas sp.]
MTFQERLRQLRTARGWSQEALAERLGLSRQAVQKWESGAARPDMDNLVTLSRLFQVSLDWLVTGAEPVAPASGQPEPAAAPAQPAPVPWHYEYKSAATVGGLPLVHINLGVSPGRFGLRPCRARGIVAIGNIATGVVAVGGFAAGMLTIGGLCAGLFSLGGLALALHLAVGGVAVGGTAIGGVAIGYLALGGCALGAFALGEQAEGIYALSTHGGVSRAALEDFWNAVGAAWPWFARLFRGFWL